MSPSAPMSKADRRRTQGGEALLHERMVARMLKAAARRADLSRTVKKKRQRRATTMATIRATCGDCGDVEMTTADVWVRICADDASGTYSFRCPTCSMVVVKGAEPHIVDLLVAAGVALSTWRRPAELNETHTGEPISHDDLLDFHDMLSDDGWYERLEQMTKR